MEKKKMLKITGLIIMLLILLFYFYQVFGMTHYQETDFVTGLVTASTLNVRSGPSTSYKIVGTIPKNEYIRVFAQIGDWYVVQTDKDLVGAVSKKYVKPIKPSSDNTTQNNQNNNTGTNTINLLTEDEKEVFYLINEQRMKAGLVALQIDSELQNVAKIKAQDMVENNYFSHTSPIYGSPFDMIKSFKISYKTAGENIAGNSKNSGAVNAWMNSEGHKANILNSSYNYTGIGVVNSPKYGKIYVQMFMGK